MVVLYLFEFLYHHPNQLLALVVVQTLHALDIPIGDQAKLVVCDLGLDLQLFWVLDNK